MTPKSSAAGKPAALVALPYWIAEFGLIRTSVLTATACLAFGLTAVLISIWQRREADDYLARAQRGRDDAYALYAHVDNEKRDIRKFQPRYVDLVKRGLVGAERRLEWVDAIRRTQESRQLPPLSYEIEPRQAVRLDAALDLGDYQLRGSRMRLHMELLHEEDLLNFLADLRRTGFFAVQECAIKRLGRSVGGGPSLGADCTLNWISLDTVSAPPAAPAKGLP